MNSLLHTRTTHRHRPTTIVAAMLIALVGWLVIGGPTANAASGGTVSNLTIAPRLVTAGTPAQGTVTLTAAAAADTVVSLSSTDTTVLTVPSSVTVPAGSTSATFTISTVRFTNSAGTFACVNGTAGGATGTDCLDVNPAPSGPTPASITFSPTTVPGSWPATGTVTLTSAASGGAVVTLSSGNPAVASVPSEAVISAGQSSVAFPVTTTAVTAATTVTITASADGSTLSVSLKVTVATGPPVPDTVRITEARWQEVLPDRGIMTIKATDSNPHAILSVLIDGSGPAEFTLTNQGGGNYQIQRQQEFMPQTILVESNFGGSATATVTQ